MLYMAERDGREVYHWPASIQELIKLKKEYGSSPDYDGDSYDIDEEDMNKYERAHNEANEAASQWHLCACGSLCKAIPRHRRSGYTPATALDAPVDYELAGLGLQFMNQIQYEDFENALLTQEKIEERAIEVLQAMGLMPKQYGTPKKKSYGE